MLGLGGLATVILSAYFGRRPVLFWFTVANLLSAIWCASAKTFPAFEAGRIVNGCFSTVSQAVCQFDLPEFGQNLTGF
jgi:predicted MFS family arabinose efflux permease